MLAKGRVCRRTSYVDGPANSLLFKKWYLRVMPLTHFFSSRRMSRCRSGLALSGSSLRGEGGQLQYPGTLMPVPTVLNVIVSSQFTGRPQIPWKLRSVNLRYLESYRWIDHRSPEGKATP